MVNKRLLITTQLSNYDSNGNFILECDSGWQMVMGRVRQMLKLNQNLNIDVTGPKLSQCLTHPYAINPDLFQDPRVSYIQQKIIPNALVTRYDFDWQSIANSFNLQRQKLSNDQHYDAVYINDPMHLRALQAMFYIEAGYKPRYYVHSHFIDNPNCPKFPTEASLWMGQLEAAYKADYNFWQCESSLEIFLNEAMHWLDAGVVQTIKDKSSAWDDGYSINEITSPVDLSNIRFDIQNFENLVENKIVIFVPNRIGGLGRSSDYTNCGKFLFEVLPELKKRRKDYVVFAGNPNQKILNHELESICGKNGYVSLVPDSLNRDEFKYIAKRSHIAVGLYNQDAYGGTAARECIELNCFPLWLNCYEYANLINQTTLRKTLLVKHDLLDVVDILDDVINLIKFMPECANKWQSELKSVIRKQCSYEQTTANAMQIMNLI